MAINPYLGLNILIKEEHKSLSPFLTFKKVEELCPSYQKGQTGDFFLFLYFINLLTKANIEFLVKGGIILNMFLDEHARPCADIDVYVRDPFKFFDEVNRALEKSSGDFSFKTKWIRSNKADEIYYQNVFAFEAYAYHEDELVKKFIVDGTYLDEYDSLKRIKYNGPEIVDKNFYFFGVSIEHMAVIKTLAVTSEQVRPIKHLIDLYSLIHIPFDIEEYKKDLSLRLDNENKIRKSLNIPTLTNKLRIRDEKEFIGGFILSELSAGYNLTKKEMVDEINDWLEEHIE